MPYVAAESGTFMKIGAHTRTEAPAQRENHNP